MHQCEDEETHEAELQAEAVQEDEAHDAASLPVAAGDASGGSMPGGDHLDASPELAAAMRRWEILVLSGDLLEAAEEDVGGGVGAGGGSAEPADERAEEGIKEAGAGEGESEGGVQTAETGDESEAMVVRRW